MSAQPKSAASGCPGFESGPSTLNTVGTPSSLRTFPAYFIAGWCNGAKQKAIPASATHEDNKLVGMLIATPSASSTSAVPALDEIARFPCLRTGNPAPATVNAAMVEMFTV